MKRIQWTCLVGLIIGTILLYSHREPYAPLVMLNLIEKEQGLLKKGVPRRLKIQPSQEKEILKQIKHSIHRGITENKRKTELIVSFTSFPRRMSKLYVTLHSLFTQTVKPDRIILWLAKEEFQEVTLPSFLKDFERMGLEVRWVEQNMRSYNKLVPTLQEHPGAIVITVDDDRYYASDLVETLYQSYEKYPKEIHCRWASDVRRDSDGRVRPYSQWGYVSEESNSGFSISCQGFNGTLYPPKALHPDVVKSSIFRKYAPTADDIWFWVNSLKNKAKSRVVKDKTKSWYLVEIENDIKLSSSNLGKDGGNDTQLAQLKHYFDYEAFFSRNASA